MIDVLVIGAGAAGLMAARELAEKGCSVAILEAADIIGGRIHSVYDKAGVFQFEAGAEFIHGDLEITFQLLQQAGIAANKTVGEMVPVVNGVWFPEEDEMDPIDSFVQKVIEEKEDTTILEVLNRYFPEGEYDMLRERITRFAEGYDLADITNASAKALVDEWSEDPSHQYRVDGGYSRLMNFLLQEARKHKTEIWFGAEVNSIEIQGAEVIAHTIDDRKFHAKTLLFTASVGVLQSGSVSFHPMDPRFQQAIEQLGFGSVLKCIVEFKSPIWQSIRPGVGFMLSNEMIPTWWTQDNQSCLLTGWIGGPSAHFMSKLENDQLSEIVTDSLSGIFGIPPAEIKNNLRSLRIFKWDQRTHIRGGYSYNKPGYREAKEILMKPQAERIFLAGEALYEGPLQGTVEAALHSGKRAATEIMRLFFS